MATKAAHIAQAVHNRKSVALLRVAGAEFRDWSIIAAFYAALHYVEACFADEPKICHTETAVRAIPKKKRPSKHQFRLDVLEDMEPPELYKLYKVLYDASMETRYLGKNNNPEDPSVANDYYDEVAATDLTKKALPWLIDELEKKYGALKLVDDEPT